MKYKFSFNEEEIGKIINHFGQDFYTKVLKDLEIYTNRWHLSNIKFIPSYSINCVFICHSELFGESVVKIGSPGKGVITEYNMLRQYNGSKFCKVFDVDLENGAIIEEYINPGTLLKEEVSLDKRLSVFCNIVNGLHIEPAEVSKYPTYIQWVTRITNYMSTRRDCIELFRHMKKAEELCLSLIHVYNGKMLLHGDIHHENIILNKDNEYILIDPKGVIGDPIFDIGQFLINEYDDEITDEMYYKLNYILEVLSKNLNIPLQVLRKCHYIQTTMSVCWDVEDGAQPTLDRVRFAEIILESNDW